MLPNFMKSQKFHKKMVEKLFK